MNISNVKGIINNLKINQYKPTFGTRMNSGLNADTLSLNSTKKIFKTRLEAILHIKPVAEKVQAALDEDDELTAFELLGYDVDSDFETEEITINGDFRPYYELYIGIPNTRKTKLYYKNIGIDEQKLMDKVVKITGKQEFSPNFKLNKNFVIDSKKIYPEKTHKQLSDLMKQRAESVNKALDKEDYTGAFKILGHEVSTDNEGKITVEDDFYSVLYKYNTGFLSYITDNASFEDYNIDLNRLLKNVVKINGRTDIGSKFVPDHFIEIEMLDYSGSIDEQYAKKDPKFQKKIYEIKKSIEKGDNKNLLMNIGLNVQEEQDGFYSVKGNIEPYYLYRTSAYDVEVPFEELGINQKELLSTVHKIDGNLTLDSSVKVLDPELEVTGTVRVPYGKEGEVFSKFISSEDVSQQLGNIDKNIIKNYSDLGIFHVSLKTNHQHYFKPEEISENKILNDIKSRRDDILTSSEICEKYSLTQTALTRALNDDKLKPYAIDLNTRKNFYNAASFLFDVTTEENKSVIENLCNNSIKSQMRNIKAQKMLEFKKACYVNGVNCEGIDNKIYAYPAKALEVQGYGDKADFVGQCKFRVNGYQLSRYILNNDVYNISTPEMMDIVLASKKSNPAIMNISKLLMQLGDSKEEFIQAVIDGKMKIITKDPYRLIEYKDYQIDLFDKDNYKTLSSIKDSQFQEWLAGKKQEYETYKKGNEAELQKFKEMKAPTQREALRRAQNEVLAYQAEQNAEEKIRQQEEQEKKKAAAKQLSLRSTIAWVLCPETRQVQNELRTPYIKSIMEKNKKLKIIQEELLANKITLEEANERIEELNLSEEEKLVMLAYHKTCWELSGTDEWKEAIKQAKILTDIYLTEGIDAIEDVNVRARLRVWEAENKKYL